MTLRSDAELEALASTGTFYRVPCAVLYFSLSISSRTGTRTVLYGVSCKTGNTEREEGSYGSSAPTDAIVITSHGVPDKSDFPHGTRARCRDLASRGNKDNDIRETETTRYRI